MRCAIYTRKSVDEAPDSQFGSNEAQREMAEKFIQSQAGDGWEVLAERYDDIGFSGGNLNRPALMRLRSDVRTRKVDVVVVYKIDRASRSLRDFLNLVTEFDAQGVTFVSVTQTFNTTTSTGRLTLNILLSFGQFERELIGERLRDWFAGARARGLWTSGSRPYGYDLDRLHLVVNDREAKAVRLAYRMALTSTSARIADALNRRGYSNTRGRPWLPAAVLLMLKNPVYLGQMTYRREPQPGTHTPLVSARDWQTTQEALAARSTIARSTRPSQPRRGLIQGMICDEEGRRLTHVVHRRGAGQVRYYEFAAKARRYERFRAPELEDAVRAAVSRVVGGVQDDAAVLAHLRSVTIRKADMQITLATGGLMTAPLAGAMKIAPRPKRTRMERPGLPSTARSNPT